MTYKISLSDNLISGAGPYRLMYRLFTKTDGVSIYPSRCGILSKYDMYYTYVMYILKGTVPSDFSTLININARLSDVLCSWRGGLNYDSVAELSLSNISGNPASINSIYKYATANGTATWFWLLQNPATSVLTTAATPIHQMFGTVGIPGSGADLVIPSVDIVTTQRYAISSLQLSFPQSWTKV